ncbi:MAG: IPT/TIG domain-containing protein [Firmicutes bacterium]|jgi:hypothetical protein|nr:IPT/TIG domain-containing protein [Bacillota bacterium]
MYKKKKMALAISILLIFTLIQSILMDFSYAFTIGSSGIEINKIEFSRDHIGYDVSGGYIQISGSGLKGITVLFEGDGGLKEMGTKVLDFETLVKYEFNKDEVLEFKGEVFCEGERFDLNTASFPVISKIDKKNLNSDEGDDLVLTGTNFDVLTSGSITVAKFSKGFDETQMIYDGGVSDSAVKMIIEDITAPGIKGFQDITISKEDTSGDPDIEITYEYNNAFRIVENLGVTGIKMYPNTGGSGDFVYFEADNFPDKDYNVYFIKKSGSGDDYSELNRGEYVTIEENIDGGTKDRLIVKVPQVTNNPDPQDNFELGEHEVYITDTKAGEIIAEQLVTKEGSADPEIFNVVDSIYRATVERLNPERGPESGVDVEILGKNLVTLNIPGIVSKGTVSGATVNGDGNLVLAYENETYNGKTVTVTREISVQIGKKVFYQKDSSDQYKYEKASQDKLYVRTDVVNVDPDDPYKNVVVEIETVLTNTLDPTEIYTFNQYIDKKDAFRFDPSSIEPTITDVIPEFIQVEGSDNNPKENMLISITGDNFLVNKYTTVSGSFINYPKVIFKTATDLSNDNGEIIFDPGATVSGATGVIYSGSEIVQSGGSPVELKMVVLDDDGDVVDGSSGNEIGTRIVLYLPKEAKFPGIGPKNLQITNPTRQSQDDGEASIKIDAFEVVNTSDVPVIESVEPNIMTAEGNEEVVITGKNFKEEAKVYLDGKEVTGITRELDKSGTKILLTFTAPEGRLGETQIEVVNPSGGIDISPFYYVQSFNQDPELTSFTPEEGVKTTLVVVDGDNFTKPDPTASSDKGLGALKLIGSRIILDDKDVNDYNPDSFGEIDFVDYTSPVEEVLFKEDGGKIDISPFADNSVVYTTAPHKVYNFTIDGDKNPVITDGVSEKYTIKYNSGSSSFEAFDIDNNTVSFGSVTIGSVTLDGKTFTVDMDNNVITKKIQQDEDYVAELSNYAHSVIFNDSDDKFYTMYEDYNGDIVLTNGDNKTYTITYDNSSDKFLAKGDGSSSYELTFTGDGRGIVIDETPSITLLMTTPYVFNSSKNNLITGNRTKVLSKNQMIFYVPSLTTGKGYKDIFVENPDTKRDGETGENGFYYFDTSGTKPVISRIEPNSGSIQGGYSAVIYGKDFSDNVKVYIDGIYVAKEDTSVNPDGDEITVTVPATNKDLAGDFGVDRMTVPVVVLNGDGGSYALEDGFTYIIPSSEPEITNAVPLSGSATGNEIVEITGEDFRFFEPYKDEDNDGYDSGDPYEDIYNNNQHDDLLKVGHDPAAEGVVSMGAVYFGYDEYYSSPILPKVYFGNKTAKVVEFAKGYIKVLTPAHEAGTVDLYIANNDSGISNKLKYTYESSNPNITTINPSFGSRKGQEDKDILGTNLLEYKVRGYTSLTNIAELSNIDSMVRFDDITNREIAREDENSGLINSNRTTVILEGGLTAEYDGNNNKLKFTLQESGKSYTAEFDYDDTKVLVPMGLLQSSGEYYRPFGYEGTGSGYQGVFEYVLVEIDDRRMFVERGYAPEVVHNGNTHLRVTTPSYYTIGNVDVTVFNPDGGTATTQFEYNNPASHPLIHDVKPRNVALGGGKYYVEGTVNGGFTIEVVGKDFRDGVQVFIGTKSATILDKTTKTEDDETYDVLIVEVPAGTNAEIDGEFPVIVQNEDGGVANSSDLKTITISPKYPIYVVYRKPLSDPTVESVEPAKTTQAGNRTITVHGKDFRAGAKIIIGSKGGVPVTDVTVSSEGKTITFETPTDLTPGAKDIQVVNADFGTGTLDGALEIISYPELTGEFVLAEDEDASASKVSVDGGDEIIIYGKNFAAGASVYLGGIRSDFVEGKEPEVDYVTGFYTDDDLDQIIDYVEATGVEVISDTKIKITMPEVSYEGEFLVTVINSDTGISDDGYYIEFSVPVPDKPRGLKAKFVNDRYIKLYGYDTERTDYYEVYKYLGKKTKSELIKNDYNDFEYVGTTEEEPYRITELEGFDQLDSQDKINFIVKAVNKYGPSKYSNIAVLEYRDFKDIDEIGPGDEDGELGVKEGYDFEIIPSRDTPVVNLSNKIRGSEINIDLEDFDDVTINVPKDSILNNTSSINGNMKNYVIGFTPTNLNSEGFRKVINNGNPYVSMDMKISNDMNTSYMKGKIPRGLKQASNIVDIDTIATSDSGNVDVNRYNGFMVLGIKYNTFNGADENTLSIFKYDEASRSWNAVGGNIDRNKKTVFTNITEPGIYTVIGDR